MSDIRTFDNEQYARYMAGKRSGIHDTYRLYHEDVSYRLYRLVEHSEIISWVAARRSYSNTELIEFLLGGDTEYVEDDWYIDPNPLRTEAIATPIQPGQTFLDGTGDSNVWSEFLELPGDKIVLLATTSL